MKIRHILLTTDLSAESLGPCLPVLELARTWGARITLFNVVHDVLVAPHVTPFAPPIPTLDVGGDVDHAREALEEQRLVLGDDIDVRIEVVVRERIHQAIVDWAETHDVDLIALSTRGRTGFRHFALGSVAEAILRHSKVPVLCFPQTR